MSTVLSFNDAILVAAAQITLALHRYRFNSGFAVATSLAAVECYQGCAGRRGLKPAQWKLRLVAIAAASATVIAKRAIVAYLS